MVLSKPTTGLPGWGPTVDALIDAHNAVHPAGSAAVQRGALPTVSALTPTITQGEFWATLITGGVQVPWTDPRLRYSLTVPVDATTLYGDTRPTYAVGKPGQRSIAWATATLNPLRVEFSLTGQQFAFRTRTNSAKWRISVDGQPLVDAPQGHATIANNDRQIRVDFGTRAERLIAIEGEVEFHFGGLYLEPAAALAAPPYPLGPRVAWVTDSFGQGGGLDGTRAYPTRASRLMGWGDIILTSCVGSTGYVQVPTTNPGGLQNFKDRLAADILTLNPKPDVVVVQGSRNDITYGGAGAVEVRDNAITVMTNLRASLPDAWLIFTGPLYMENPATGTQSAASIQSQILTAYNQVFATPGAINPAKRVAFIDTLSPVLAGGTGTTDTPTGDGPADYLRHPDGTHPSQAGHAFLEKWMAGQLARIFPSAA